MSELTLDKHSNQELHALWKAAAQEKSQLVLLKGEMGSGSRKIIRRFQNEVAEQCITWHLRCLPEERGLYLMPKIADGLWKGIRKSEAMTKSVITRLRAAQATAENEAEKQRIEVMIKSLLWSRKKNGDQTLLPDDRPLTGLMHLGEIILNNYQTLIIVEDAHFSQEMVIYAWLDSVLNRTKDKSRAMIIFSSDADTGEHSWTPQGLSHLMETYEGKELNIQPWGEPEIESFLNQTKLKIDAPSLKWWTNGLPARLLEINSTLKENPDLAEAYSRSGFYFEDDDEEKLLRNAALRNFRFSIPELAKLVDMDVVAVEEKLHNSRRYGFETFTKPGTRESQWEFQTISVREKLREDTIKNHPELSILFYDRLEKMVGIKDTQAMFSVLRGRADLDDPKGVNRIQEIFHAMAGDQIWLHLSDLCFSEDLNWPIGIMGRSLLSGLLYLCSTDPERANVMLEWALRWSGRKNVPTLGMELLRIASKHFAGQGNFDQARKMLEDAIEIAQLTKEIRYSIGIHLDLAELYASLGNERAANEQITLVKSIELDAKEQIRCASIQARISRTLEKHSQAASHYLEARKLASENDLNRMAADAGLLAIESLIQAGDPLRARKYLDIISEEVRYDLPRLGRCQELEAQIFS